MRDQAHMEMIVKETTDLRVWLQGELGRIGIDFVPSHTNFVLMRFADPAQAADVQAALHAEAIILRPMAGYGLPDALRVTIGLREDMEAMLAVLAAWKGRNT